jgi:hypothetical protein
MWRQRALAAVLLLMPIGTALAKDQAKPATCTQWWHICTEGVRSRGGNTDRRDSAQSACLSSSVWDTATAATWMSRGNFGHVVTGLIRK